MTIIVHHHIFKNAGTTIDWILERNFPGQVLHIEGHDPGARLRSKAVQAAAARRPDHRAIASHSFPLPRPQHAWALVHLSVLRDPIERYASIHRFEQSRELPRPANEAARTLGFRDFCLWWLENRPGIWTNWQTKCCTPQRGRLKALRWLETWAWRAFGRGPRPLRRLRARRVSRLRGWNADLDLALKAALKTGLVFTVDRFDQGLVLLEEELSARGIELDASYIRQNISRNESDPSYSFDELLGRDLHRELIEANALDYELLRQVRASVDRRYAELDPTGGRLQAFRKRCEDLGTSTNGPLVRVPGQSDWILVSD